MMLLQTPKSHLPLNNQTTITVSLNIKQTYTIIHHPYKHHHLSQKKHEVVTQVLEFNAFPCLNGDLKMFDPPTPSQRTWKQKCLTLRNLTPLRLTFPRTFRFHPHALGKREHPRIDTCKYKKQTFIKYTVPEKICGL